MKNKSRSEIKYLAIFMLIFMFIAPFTITAIEKSSTYELAAQTVLFKRMLSECNHQYMHNSTPMYQHNLIVQQYLAYVIPFVTSGHNAERLLTEAQDLSEVIIIMEKLQNLEHSNDQIKQLLEMLLQCNKTYLENTPVYKQDLTTQWYWNYCFPINLLQNNSSYNAEILLTESKKLAALTYNMSQFQNN